VWQTQEAGSPYPLLHKEYQTPAGPLSAVVKRTEDWPWGDDIPFFDDFSPPRYAKPWITGLDDVERLRYLLQPARGADRDRVAKSYREARTLGKEHDAIVGAGGGTGLDFVCWFCGFEQAVLFAMEQPAIIDGLLDIAARIYLASTELLCELGVDYIERRGWYESADFWSPALYRRFARPLLEKEVALAHACQCPVRYLMVTGIMPLLPQLAEIPFDALIQIEPVLGGQDQRRIVQALGDKKAFLGGISAPAHLHQGTPEQVRQAVREAFEVFGHRGFTLGCSAGIRPYFPWENVQAMIDEWKRLR
jgi:uroporphyrinogen-III decarboxylase